MNSLREKDGGQDLTGKYIVSVVPTFIQTEKGLLCHHLSPNLPTLKYPLKKAGATDIHLPS